MQPSIRETGSLNDLSNLLYLSRNFKVNVFEQVFYCCYFLAFFLCCSGGTLLDSEGNLIGINTAIFTQTGTSAGVGFAIPSSTVLKIVPQLIKFGKE
ncbi:hypothetical protein PVK06_036586 [Gossypium arboreum]|uniref:Protease Do-like 8, chloroplastic n=1 Tax=Gossypium arboreum TaxID=29729 RepID=A0ABR0NKB1_GOSAR|nr:hypothetical protein PVK06_036586 [Gossypium arboreum]